MILIWQGAMATGNYISDTLARTAPLSARTRNSIPQLLLAAILSVILVPALSIRPVQGNQMIQIAKQVSEMLPRNNPVVLIGSDGERESGFIAQLAQLDPARPSMFAVRGSRLLGKEEGFMNIDYAPKFNSPEEVLGELERLSICMVILDTAKKSQAWKHNRDIEWLINNKPDLWRKLYSMDNPGGDGAIEIYILKSSERKTPDMPLIRKQFGPNSGHFGTPG